LASASTKFLFPLLLDLATETAKSRGETIWRKSCSCYIGVLGATTNHGDSISDGVGVAFSALPFSFLSITT
jgi:hypothetical protein